MRTTSPTAAIGLVAAVVGLAAFAGAGSATAAGTATSAVSSRRTCTGAVKITSLTFAPPAVAPGQSSVATLVARNCTGQTQQVTTTWYGRFLGPNPGIPVGCPALDPLPRPLTLAPHRSARLDTTYLAFTGCTATSMLLTVQVLQTSGTVTATATLTINP